MQILQMQSAEDANTADEEQLPNYLVGDIVLSCLYNPTKSKYVLVPLTSCSRVLFKTNYKKVKLHYFFISRSQKYFSSQNVICSMFAIEPDSFNSYSCSALTEVNNPSYMLGRLP